MLQNVLCNTYNVAPGLVEITFARWVLGDLRRRKRIITWITSQPHSRSSLLSMQLGCPDGKSITLCRAERILSIRLTQALESGHCKRVYFIGRLKTGPCCLVELRPGRCAARPRGPHPCAWRAAPVAAFVGGVCVSCRAVWCRSLCACVRA